MSRPCIADLDRWIDRDFSYADADPAVLVERHDQGQAGLLLRVRTTAALYEIRVQLPEAMVLADGTKGSDGGLMACEARCTTYRPGDSLVGRRLVDGPFDEETWHRIVAAMLSYELRPMRAVQFVSPEIVHAPAPAYAADFVKTEM